MCMCKILILVRKVQNKGKYWEINWISMKINWKQRIAIYCNTVKIYRNTFFLYRDTPIDLVVSINLHTRLILFLAKYNLKSCVPTTVLYKKYSMLYISFLNTLTFCIMIISNVHIFQATHLYVIDLMPSTRHHTCWQTYSLSCHNQMNHQIVVQLWRHIIEWCQKVHTESYV